MGQSENATLSKGPCVLVIADDESYVSETCKELQASGFRTIGCGKASEAMSRLKNQKFSCVVLDCLLKSGTAEHVVSSAKKDARSLNFSTPIILTSRSFEADLLKRLRAQIFTALLRPFALGDLIEKVKGVANDEETTRKAA